MKRLFLIALLVAEVPAWAALHYARPTAQGTASGADWNNAWALTGINWASVAAGDTVYFSGGTYGAFSSGKAGSVGNKILIRRAMASNTDCTGAAGWSAAFDSQANLAGLTMGMFNYVRLSGETPSGIKVSVGTGGMGGSIAMGNGTATGVEVAYVEFAGNGSTGSSSYGMQLGLGGHAGKLVGCVLDHCIFHDLVNGLQVYDVSSTLFSYCEWYNINGSSSAHPNAIYMSGDEINNVWLFCALHDSNTLGFGYEDGCLCTSNVYAGCWFYNNIAVQGGICTDSSANNIQSLYVYNCVDFNSTDMIYIKQAPGNLVVRNCIFWNESNGSFVNGGTVSFDYNFYSGATSEPHGVGNGSNPFVNGAAHDFHIVSTVGASYPRNKGVAIANFTTDPDGNVRGADGLTDIGVFEYASAAGTPPTITVQPTPTSTPVGGSFTLSLTALGSPPLAYQWYNQTNGTAGNAIAGATGASYTKVNAQTSDSTNYSCVVTNLSGSVTSAAPFVTVTNGTSPAIGVGSLALTFSPTATNTTEDLTVGVTNLGTGTLSGTASISSPYSVVSGASYSLAAGAGQLVTVRFSPTAHGVFNGTLAFTGGGGTNVPVSGIAFYIWASNSIPIYNDVVISPFSTVGANSVMQTVDNSSSPQGSGEAIAGFYLDALYTVNLTATAEATNRVNNSSYIQIDGEPLGQAQQWTITNVLSSGLQTQPVSWVGNGTSDLPQFPTNVWTLGVGNHYIVLRGREANTRFGTFTVNVQSPPVISAQPPDVSVPANSPATFTVTANGSPTLSYQWKKNGSNITGATQSSYTTPAATAGDSGATFAVVVTNPYGAATSRTATLNVSATVQIGTISAGKVVSGKIVFQ